MMYPWKSHHLSFIAFFTWLAVLECRPFGTPPTKHIKYRLLADVLPQGVKKNGNDLWIEKPGAYNLTLLNDQLELGTQPQNCIGNIIVCYDSDSSIQSSVNHLCQKYASTCPFYLTMTADDIWFMQSQTEVGNGKTGMGHTTVALTGEYVLFGKMRGPTCKPKIINKQTRIQVEDASQNCPVIIKNANIKSPEATTPPVEDGNLSTTESSSAGMPTWLIIVLSIIGFLVLVLLVGLCYWIYTQYFKKNDSKQTSSGTLKNTAQQDGDQTEGAKTAKPIEAMTKLPITCAPVQSVVAEKALPAQVKVAEPAETRPIEKPEGLATAIPSQSKEPSVAPAKLQAQEPLVKVDKAPKELKATVPKEAVKNNEPKAVEEKHQERPPCFQVVVSPKLRRNCKPTNPDAAVPTPASKLDQSGSVVKSKRKADSAQIEIQERNQHLLPVHIISLTNIFSSRMLMRTTMERYPRAGFALEREIHLFLCPMSEMFAELEKMGTEAEGRLLKAGLVLDSKKKIIGEVDDRVRRLVVQSDTPEFVRHYMFGLEFSELMTPHIGNLKRMSLSVLFVVAICPVFDTLVRRKAAAILRRRQVVVQAWWPLEERNLMPFPICAFESAYNKDPRAFGDSCHVKTDSQRSKRERAALKKVPSTKNVSHETETRDDGGKSAEVNQSRS